MSEFWRKLRFLFQRERFDQALDEEMQSHIEMRADELQQAGLGRADALAQARREFGSSLRTREDTRSAWQIRWLEDLASDLTHALRALRRSPGFAAAAILSLALGIGANTAIFTLINALLLRTLPVHEPRQLVLVDRSNVESRSLTSFPYPFYQTRVSAPKQLH